MDKPTALWIGATDGPELGLARRWLSERLRVVDEASADACSPLIACLAIDCPGRPAMESAIRVGRAWPLCRVVAVASSLAEGRRRSGPPLPGIEEIPWHDLPGRLELWLDEIEAGRAGPLGMPATSRREERILEGLRSTAAWAVPSTSVAVAATRADALESLTGLFEALGCRPVSASLGRPAMSVEADAVVWDCGGSLVSELEWLRVLAAHRPSMAIVLLESFPRGDRALQAIHAGAACVLGRLASGEVLLGTLRWLARRRDFAAGSGLGAHAEAG